MFLVGFNKVGLHQGPRPKKLKKLSDTVLVESKTLSLNPPLFLSHNCIASSFQSRKTVSRMGNLIELLSKVQNFQSYCDSLFPSMINWTINHKVGTIT